MVLGVVILVWRSSRLESEQLERSAELVSAASVLSEALSTDLASSLPMTVLPPGEFVRGRPASRLVLPIGAGHRSDRTPSLTYRPLRYEFDPARGTIRRGGRLLVAGGPAEVTFAWSAAAPTTLTVTLSSRAGARVQLELAAPQRTDPPAHWVFARHHRGALPAD